MVRHSTGDADADVERLMNMILALHKETDALGRVVKLQGEHLELVARLVDELVNASELHKMRVDALEGEAETIGGMITGLEQRVSVAFQAVQREFAALKRG
jgi:hypothetical protein